MTSSSRANASLSEGQAIPFRPSLPLAGIAMGGDTGVARVDVSSDGGRQWHSASLGKDHGRYSFRQWEVQVPLKAPGKVTLMTRCTNSAGVTQPMRPVWNPSGYMRGNVEITHIEVRQS
ncbi:putative oxidoreductase [Sphingobium sp. SYK-6]|uniref:oxidoreductase n=1 Tax=Sphingobium sp. (strain NBRC 103272 / SYK-6) TaxID=627192 RepID=UPI0002276F8C|nr:oxidoreductase [Sphingobium sp. SYK-6]BAK67373.1 putative oxidoreductase [Sphingobium sp. SYK-6]